MVALIRFGVYCVYHRPSFGPLARLRTGRRIILGYDRVFIVPLVVFAVSVVVPSLILSLSGSPPITVFLTVATLGMSPLGLSPSLYVWYLTGRHHIAFDQSGRSSN